MSKNMEIGMLLDVYGHMLTEKQSEIMDYYYNNDYSLAEISELLGISRQGVRDAIKHSEIALNGLEEKLGLSDKYRKEEEKKAKLEELIKKIVDLNTYKLRDEQLQKWIVEIYDTIREEDNN